LRSEPAAGTECGVAICEREGEDAWERGGWQGREETGGVCLGGRLCDVAVEVWEG